MEKIIVVSTNNNPDYYFYLPYIEKAWNSLGWRLCVMLTHDVNVNDLVVNNKDTMLCVFPKVDELRPETVAQTSRLYAAHWFSNDALLMTSDMDLLPLSDYWHPKENEITNYGHDLTGFSFYPMGYTAMSASKWKEVMNITHDVRADMIRDAKETGLPYKEDWESWWNHDWTLLTKRLQPYKSEMLIHLRGNRAGSSFAFGRVDRGDSMQIPNEPLIDAHCENVNVRHPEKLGKFINLFESHYGKL